MSSIYDIYYNDLNEYVVLCEGKTNDDLHIKINHKQYLLQKLPYTHGHTTVYILHHDYVEEVEVNGVGYKVNKYSSFPNDILLRQGEKNEVHYLIQRTNIH